MSNKNFKGHLMKRRQYSFEQLKKVGHKHYKDTNFCTLIAVAISCKVSFGMAYGKTKELVNRKHSKGLFIDQYLTVIESLNCVVSRFKKNHFNRTVNQVIRDLPTKGIFLIQTNGHVSTYIDGSLQDCVKTNSRKRVRAVYQVTRNF